MTLSESLQNDDTDAPASLPSFGPSFELEDTADVLQGPDPLAVFDGPNTFNGSASHLPALSETPVMDSPNLLHIDHCSVTGLKCSPEMIPSRHFASCILPSTRKGEDINRNERGNLPKERDPSAIQPINTDLGSPSATRTENLVPSFGILTQHERFESQLWLLYHKSLGIVLVILEWGGHMGWGATRWPSETIGDTLASPDWRRHTGSDSSATAQCNPSTSPGLPVTSDVAVLVISLLARGGGAAVSTPSSKRLRRVVTDSSTFEASSSNDQG